MTFAGYLEKILPQIDAAMGEDLLSFRPFLAAHFIANHLVVDAPGGKEDFLDKEWFGAIYAEVYLWYGRRYGDAISPPGTDAVSAILPHENALLALSVPIAAGGPEKEPEHSWLMFPSRVIDEEDPSEWLRAGPSLAAMGGDERKRFTEKLVGRATTVRKAVQLYMTAICANDSHERLMASVIPHLHAGAGALTRQAGPSMLGLWDLHLAAEKANIADSEGADPRQYP